MVNKIYPAELHLNKSNTPDTEASFLDLNLSIFDANNPTKIYDKRDDFIFLNSTDMLGHIAMLLTSTLAINC